ncbi:CDP-glycerol glycerophosphotransferase family protein [Eubacterium oxidoreducens]|uniref:CDP-ribitol ribitolphosphotransferase n=1 Tax=Eubacterium oxidoreducens TaxID=1732 RepID=A0A1G6CNH7_EUBOX|nr:CDP-glycerol glycerophosphotransferase family protein [Eubacterium oxidoreducens]SDB34439.1 CDP-ribitol ribitolphosphotransferase [Eubacterium oxidoreducens]
MLTIHKIYWERVNVHFVFDRSVEGASFCLTDGKVTIALIGKENELAFNISNTPGGEMLDKGTWRILYENTPVTVAYEFLSKLGDKSRIFPYNGNKKAYLVQFSLEEEEDGEAFVIRTNFMVENRYYKRFRSCTENATLKGKCATIAKNIYIKLLRCEYALCYAFARNQDKTVLFFTENGEQLSGNLKALYETDMPGYRKAVYAINTFSDENHGLAIRARHAIRQVAMLAKANLIFVDNYVPVLSLVPLKKTTRLVQLWHAGVGFKAVGYARFGMNGSPHPYVSCHRRYTDVIVDREELTDIYSEVFGCDPEKFKALGMPRLDGYLSHKTIEQVTQRLYEKNPLLKECKVILFSPTFRGKGSSNAYWDYSKLDLERLAEYCRQQKALFIVKMHPFVQEAISIPKECQDVIWDWSDADINELIYVADIMITDYSSCVYEYSLFQRPLIFYRYDKAIYEYQRPMHTLDLFTKEQYEATTFDELMDVLSGIQVSVSERFAHMSQDTDRQICRSIVDWYTK